MKTRQSRKVGLAVGVSLAGGLLASNLAWRTSKARNASELATLLVDDAKGAENPAQTLAHTPTRAERYFFETLDDAPPSSDYWPAVPASLPSTAQPAAYQVGVASADDWDSVEPEQLGALFLARATESETNDDEG